MTAPDLSIEGQARARARVILSKTDEAAVSKGWAELEREYGYDLASAIWREVGNELDAQAEEDDRVAAERELLETLADVEAAFADVLELGFGRDRHFAIVTEEGIAAVERLLERRRNRP